MGKSVTARRILSTPFHMQKAAVAMLLGMLMCAGCGKHSDAQQAAQRARGHALPDLVFAANAPVFDAGGIPYAEAVWIDGIWKIHDGGVWRADCRNDDEIYKAMQEIWEKRQDSRILISAGGGMALREIVNVIRGSAKNGFWRMDFLVATGVPSREIHSFLLNVPKAEGCGIRPDIDPLLITLDARGLVYTGTGPDRRLHDTDPADHALPKINELLEIHAATAKAAGFRPPVLLHADPAVNYQRFIDLFARFHEHRITEIMLRIDDVPKNDEPLKRWKSFNHKPRPPSSPLPPDE
jgi:biopolymer transport protein ExbD